MKTVLVDNSLCAYPLRDDVDPELICNYILALKNTGVKYIELDFRTMMEVRRLPEGVNYILRMVDPTFLSLANNNDFSYIVLVYPDLKKRIKTDVPIMLEMPYVSENMDRLPEYVQSQVDGKLAAFRVRWGFEYDQPYNIFDIYSRLRRSLAPYPVDICPMNSYRTALDSALKFTAASADSLTLTAGLPIKYCSLEEYLFTLMTVFDSLPPEFDIQSLGRLSVYRNHIFKGGESALPKLVDSLDSDIRLLRNVDSGERVGMRIGLKDTEYLSRKFISVLEKMAQEQNIPGDLFEDITNAINHYDRGMYNKEVFRKKRTGLLN